MHQNDSFSGAGTSQYPNRTIAFHLDQFVLSGVKEYSPFIQRGIQHFAKLCLITDQMELGPGGWASQRSLEVTGIDLVDGGL